VRPEVQYERPWDGGGGGGGGRGGGTGQEGLREEGNVSR
jgi:hypothetical protein